MHILPFKNPEPITPSTSPCTTATSILFSHRTVCVRSVYKDQSMGRYFLNRSIIQITSVAKKKVSISFFTIIFIYEFVISDNIWNISLKKNCIIYIICYYNILVQYSPWVNRFINLKVAWFHHDFQINF